MSQRYLFARVALAFCIALLSGCSLAKPKSFTLTADLPPQFAYVAVVNYGPVKGQICTVRPSKNKSPVFNREWRTEYKPNSEIALYRSVDGCSQVATSIAIEINVSYGKTSRDVGGHSATILIRDEETLEASEPFVEGESTFYGQCQSLFRTSGKPRVLRKILNCHALDGQGNAYRYRPLAKYTPDQLAGKTVKLKIDLIDEEPYIHDTWVKFPNGWKRCMGKGLEDTRALCDGNRQDFSSFQMPDGQQCTIYPGCTE